MKVSCKCGKEIIVCDNLKSCKYIYIACPDCGEKIKIESSK
jgi:DNA-directed RNA polymerase subunit RPC12/RpoP